MLGSYIGELLIGLCIDDEILTVSFVNLTFNFELIQLETFTNMSIRRLPQEIQTMITDYFLPRDYLNFRDAVGLHLVGRYRARHIQVHDTFRGYMVYPCIQSLVMFGMNISIWSIPWGSFVLLVDTGRVRLDELWADDNRERQSLAYLLGCVAASIPRLDVMHWLLSLVWQGMEEDLSRILIHCFKRDFSTHIDVLRLLLADGRVDPSLDSNLALSFACRHGRHRGLALLLQDGRVDPGLDNSHSILTAILGGDDECLRLLLTDARADPAVNDNEALRQAYWRRDFRIFRLLLLDHRVDPTASDNELLREVSLRGQADILELLLANARFDPSANENFALRTAARFANVDCLALLLAHPSVDPAAHSNYAIRRVAMMGDLECMRLLIADPRVDPSALENAALIGAISRRHEGCIRLLLTDPRVDKNLVDPKYWP